MSAFERDPVCWSWPIPEPSDQDAWHQLVAFHARRCGICGDPTHVLDHDHRSGLARGWLCRSCNRHEGLADSPTDVFARWRAVPSAAMLGLLIPYVSAFRGGATFDEDAWTGFLYLPDHAPAAPSWPHAMTCAEPAVVELDGTLSLPCGHDHDAAIRLALSVPGGTVER